MHVLNMLKSFSKAGVAVTLCLHDARNPSGTQDFPQHGLYWKFSTAWTHGILVNFNWLPGVAREVALGISLGLAVALNLLVAIARHVLGSSFRIALALPTQCQGNSLNYTSIV